MTPPPPDSDAGHGPRTFDEGPARTSGGWAPLYASSSWSEPKKKFCVKEAVWGIMALFAHFCPLGFKTVHHVFPRAPPRVGNALVQAPPGVGAANFWSFTIAWTKGGGGVTLFTARQIRCRRHVGGHCGRRTGILGSGRCSPPSGWAVHPPNDYPLYHIPIHRPPHDHFRWRTPTPAPSRDGPPAPYRSPWSSRYSQGLQSNISGGGGG